MKLHISRIVFLVMGIMALAACDSQSSKLPHIRTEMASHPVAFANGAVKLSGIEQASLQAFAENISPSSVSYVALAADDRNRYAVMRARSVRNYLVKEGYDKNIIRLVPTPDLDSRTIIVSVQFARALPPAPCPDWSKNSIENYDNTDASNFGCAYYNDMTVQLANPEDYNEGHGRPAMDGARDSVFIGNYLTGAKPAVSSTTSSGGASGNFTTSTSSATP